MVNVEAHDRVSHDQNDEQDIHDAKPKNVCKGIEIEKVNGKYLKSKTLKLKINKKTLKAKTNKKGVATFKLSKSVLKKLKKGKMLNRAFSCQVSDETYDAIMEEFLGK